MLCESKTCAPLDCPEEEIIRDEKSCCPKCKAKKQCKYRGKNYKVFINFRTLNFVSQSESHILMWVNEGKIDKDDYK